MIRTRFRSFEHKIESLVLGVGPVAFRPATMDGLDGPLDSAARFLETSTLLGCNRKLVLRLLVPAVPRRFHSALSIGFLVSLRRELQYNIAPLCKALAKQEGESNRQTKKPIALDPVVVVRNEPSHLEKDTVMYPMAENYLVSVSRAEKQGMSPLATKCAGETQTRDEGTNKGLGVVGTTPCSILETSHGLSYSSSEYR